MTFGIAVIIVSITNLKSSASFNLFLWLKSLIFSLCNVE